MRARFLGRDPESQHGSSPTSFATDRTDRVTFLAQGWVVTDPDALADVGERPPGEAVVELPVEVLMLALDQHRGVERRVPSPPTSSARCSSSSSTPRSG